MRKFPRNGLSNTSIQFMTKKLLADAVTRFAGTIVASFSFLGDSCGHWLDYLRYLSLACPYFNPGYKVSIRGGTSALISTISCINVIWL